MKWKKYKLTDEKITCFIVSQAERDQWDISYYIFVLWRVYMWLAHKNKSLPYFKFIKRKHFELISIFQSKNFKKILSLVFFLRPCFYNTWTFIHMQFKDRRCYELNGLFLAPHIRVLKANPQCDDIWKWGLEEMIRSWGCSLHWMESVPLWIETSERCLTVFTMWGHREKVSMNQEVGTQETMNMRSLDLG